MSRGDSRRAGYRFFGRLLVVALVVGSCTPGSYVGRWVLWNVSDIGDVWRFPAREVDNEPPVFRFRRALLDSPLEVTVERSDGSRERRQLTDLAARSGTTALLVARDEELLFEGYYNGYERDSVNTSFSVAKSITSLLVGIAIDEGLIASVDDPVTRYLPELAERDPRFSRITLRHLLDMKSGIRFSDHEFVTGDRARAYYHPHLRRVVLEGLAIAEPPGERWVYNTYNPILLGLVLERASGGTVAAFLETRLWRRLGMEFPGSWSVDGTVDPLEKMESGINGRAVDFLKIGRLVLRQGAWQGRRIVSEEWIRASTTIDEDCMVPAYPPPRDVCYQLAWWLTPPTHGRRFAVGGWGHRGQYLYVFPEEELVIVRFGKELGGVRWSAVFQAMVSAIAGYDRDEANAG